MKFDVARKFIDSLLDNSYKDYIDIDKCKGIVFEFIGGEPFLEIELIREITTYIENSLIEKNPQLAINHMFSFSTNGTLYFQPAVQSYINDYKDRISISITIDGNKELHDSCRLFPDGSGSYDLAIAAEQDYLNRFGSTTGSKLTIAPGNLSYLDNALISMIKFGYKDIHANCVFEKGWEAHHATEYYERLKIVADYILDNKLFDDLFISLFREDSYRKLSEDDNNNWCGGNGDMLAVDWRGDLYPCLRYMPSSLGDDQEPYKIGNVYDGIMTSSEECDKVSCLKCITRKSQSTDECWNCPIAAGCAWCTAYNYQVFGTPNKRATFICQMHKAASLANVYYWNKYYRIVEETEAKETGFITLPIKRFRLWLSDAECLKIISQEELDMLHELERL